MNNLLSFSFIAVTLSITYSRVVARYMTEHNCIQVHVLIPSIHLTRKYDDADWRLEY